LITKRYFFNELISQPACIKQKREKVNKHACSFIFPGDTSSLSSHQTAFATLAMSTFLCNEQSHMNEYDIIQRLYCFFRAHSPENGIKAQWTALIFA